MTLAQADPLPRPAAVSVLSRIQLTLGLSDLLIEGGEAWSKLH